MRSILTFHMCSSLAQLCFINMNLAKNTWTSILPSVWSTFNDDQKNLLSERAVNFLINSKIKNNFMAVFYEAIVLCVPKINFEPYAILFN